MGRTTRDAARDATRDAARDAAENAADEAADAAAMPRAEDAYAAGTMLMAALFSDAMGRDMLPGLYPEPADRAPALYVRLFLRAVRCARVPRRRARPSTSKVRT